MTTTNIQTNQETVEIGLGRQEFSENILTAGATMFTAGPDWQPAVDDGLIYQGHRHLHLLALDALVEGTQSLSWTALSTPCQINPTFDSGVVVLTNTSGSDPNTLLFTKTFHLSPGQLSITARLENYSQRPLSVTIAFSASADFEDHYRLRGIAAPLKGTWFGLEQHTANEFSWKFRTVETEAHNHRTKLRFDPVAQATIHKAANPAHDHIEAKWAVTVPPQGSCEVCITVTAQQWKSGSSPKRPAPIPALETFIPVDRIRTSNSLVNKIVAANMHAFRSQLFWTEDGKLVPSAGVPAFNGGFFGRDSAKMAEDLLPNAHLPAREILSALLERQGAQEIPWRYEEVGKLGHEFNQASFVSRHSPLGRNYAAFDSSPKAIHLLARYIQASDDLDFLKTYWERLLLCAAWLDKVSYPEGLPMFDCHLGNQVTEDAAGFLPASSNTGSFVRSLEVAAYSAVAYQGLVAMANLLGKSHLSNHFKKRQKFFQNAIRHIFWNEQEEVFSWGLAGPEESWASRIPILNPTVCVPLQLGLATPEQARKTLEKLLYDESVTTRWGLTGKPANSPGYNPLDYGITIAANRLMPPFEGACIYGERWAAERLFRMYIDLASQFPTHVPPEMVVPHPGAPAPLVLPGCCARIGWVSTAVVGMLNAFAGVRVDARHNSVVLVKPFLPPELDWVELPLQVGKHQAPLRLDKVDEEGNVHAGLLKNDVPINVTVIN